MLVDSLGLPFSEVSTCLDGLRGRDPGWWMLGKLVAYQMQTVPFVHLDSDVFLWQRLPGHIEAAPVLAQHPEIHTPDQGVYHPGEVEQAFAETGGILPVEWRWARARSDGLTAENCGIVGGCDIGFMHHFAETALDLIERPENAAGWVAIRTSVVSSMSSNSFCCPPASAITGSIPVPLIRACGQNTCSAHGTRRATPARLRNVASPI